MLGYSSMATSAINSKPFRINRFSRDPDRDGIRNLKYKGEREKLRPELMLHLSKNSLPRATYSQPVQRL